jgi:hypothetical protein
MSISDGGMAWLWGVVYGWLDLYWHIETAVHLQRTPGITWRKPSLEWSGGSKKMIIHDGNLITSTYIF